MSWNCQAEGILGRPEVEHLWSGYGNFQAIKVALLGVWSPTLPEKSLRCGLDSDLVVHGRSDPLGTAEITLCRLHRNVPQEELDLFQFAARGAAESGTGPAKVVRREVAHACLCGELLNDVLGKFLGAPLSPRPASATHATK